MKNKVNYFILLLLIIISGCETPIDLNIKEMDSKYFVEGYITSDSTYQYVKLCNTKNYLADNSFVSVSDAEVFVIELLDKTILSTISFKYDLIQQKYKSINPMSGTAGRVYQLHIIIGDKEIVGEDIMNTKFYLDSLKFQETRQNRQNQTYHYFDILGYVQEPGATKNDAYMWDAVFKGKSLTNTLRNKNIQSDEPINGNYLSGMTVIYSWAFDSIINSGRTTSNSCTAPTTTAYIPTTTIYAPTTTYSDHSILKIYDYGNVGLSLIVHKSLVTSFVIITLSTYTTELVVDMLKESIKFPHKGAAIPLDSLSIRVPNG